MNKSKNNVEKNSLNSSNTTFTESSIKSVPVLFNKKIKKLLVKPLKHIYSDTGKSRHFTPAAQEWFNSIYSFNKNYVKTLPTADKNLMDLLKSYFNFNWNIKILKKIKQLPIRYRRLSAKKIFVGKGDLKHTNNKVVITFFVYNVEKLFLLSQLKKIHRSLFYPYKCLKEFININRHGKKIITYNRPFTLAEYLSQRSHYEEWYFSYVLSFINKLNRYYSNINTYYETIRSLMAKNIINDDEKKDFINIIDNIYTFDYPNYNIYMNKCSWNYRKNLHKNLFRLKFNKNKFKNIFLDKLRSLVYNIYNKKIEFNIVDLKKMHLNSDIFTQAVSLKLRNRDNKLYRVLKSSLRKLKLRNVRRARRQNKRDKNEYIVNNIRNNNINSMFTTYNVKDPLDNLLLNYFPWSENLKINIAKFSSIFSRSLSLDTYVLRNLKHRKMAGIRVEAKGRLTRRFTAARSVFKMKWKGGLKNVDSSFKGLSAIMLRGDVKSNIQYSLLNSKNRNGAFGVKGWVSGT